MLTIDEQDVVRAALARTLAVDGNVRQYITATFVNRSTELLLALPDNLVLPERQAAFVLGQCLDARWPPPPQISLLELLLTQLIDAGGDTALVPLRNRVRLGETADPTPDPAKMLWINETMPFFSRAKVRPIVKGFLNKDVQPILRVIGPKDAGKSYTRWFIDHVSKLRSDQRVLFAEVPEDTGPSYAVEELVDQLLVTVPHSGLPPRANSNYAAAVARWIVNTVSINITGRSIIVLDGFNQTDLHAETRELVRNLAQQVAGIPDVRRRLRLALIDYDASIPNIHLGSILSETVPAVGTLTVEDVESCLTAHYDDLKGRGKPQAITPDVVKQTAAGFMADANANGALDLQALNDMLTKLRLDDLQP